MELIKGYLKTVKVPVPGAATALSASITSADGAVVIAASVPVEHDDDKGLADILIPYEAVAEERNLLLHVEFTIESNTYDKKVTLNVATPYLELYELEQILENDNEDEAWAIEAAVRHIINAHTGQEFGVSEEPMTIVGNYENVLGTTRPIIRLDKLVEDGIAVYDRSVPQGTDWFLGKDGYTVTGDGWYVKRPQYGVNSIKADRGNYYSSNPIKAPSWHDNSFVNDVTYEVHGRFGYEEIPPEVVEAAKLLVNDYACEDSMYRDRYLKSVRSADWRIEYAAGAWVATGNARADLLLGPFVVNRILVI